MLFLLLLLFCSQVKMTSKRLDKNQLQTKIYEILGYTQDSAYEPSLQRTRQEIGGNKLQKQLSTLTSKSQRKKKRLNQQMNAKIGQNLDIMDEVKQLEWRLQVLRSDRQEKERTSSNLTFQELYNRQKNKYSQIRQRNKMKMTDERYIDMLGSNIMRREKRKLDVLTKLEKHIEMLDNDIKTTNKQHKFRARKPLR